MQIFQVWHQYETQQFDGYGSAYHSVREDLVASFEDFNDACAFAEKYRNPHYIYGGCPCECGNLVVKQVAVTTKGEFSLDYDIVENKFWWYNNYYEEHMKRSIINRFARLLEIATDEDGCIVRGHCSASYVYFDKGTPLVDILDAYRHICEENKLDFGEVYRSAVSMRFRRKTTPCM